MSRAKRAPAAPSDKQRIREETWRALQEAGAARFPGVRGRIPNFVGAEAAARALAELPAFRRARHIKCNPDSPQRTVRHLALKAGKRVYMAVPRLAEAAPFLALDPHVLGPERLWEASSIKGATALGVPVSLVDMPVIDLIVTGCVAVGRDGTRLGKGGGYSDLEYALLSEAGRLAPRAEVWTCVHAVQVREAGELPCAPHDQVLTGYVTEEGPTRCQGRRRPGRIRWRLLDDEQLEAMPAVGALKP